MSRAVAGSRRSSRPLLVVRRAAGPRRRAGRGAAPRRRRGRRGGRARDPGARRRGGARATCPIYLEGLGTVTAFKTVTVRAQVDGRLDKVALHGGAGGQEGRRCSRRSIRARSQIQLHQAEAALARDTAQLRRRASATSSATSSCAAQKLIAAAAGRRPARAGRPARRRRCSVDQAQIENARLQLDYARITSPIDGVTGVRLVDPGNLVHADRRRPASSWSRSSIRSRCCSRCRRTICPTCRSGDGRRARSPVEACSRDGAQQARRRASSRWSTTRSTRRRRRIRLKAIFPNPDRALWPNQFVKARLLLDDAQGRARGAGGRRCSAGRRARSSTSSAPTTRPQHAAGRGRRRPRATSPIIAQGPRGRRAGRRRGAEPAAPGREGRAARDGTPARRGAAARRGAPREEPRREHLRAVHPAAGRDDAADGRRSCSAGIVGYRAAAGLGAAAGRLPDHRRLDASCRAPAPRRWPRR